MPINNCKLIVNFLLKDINLNLSNIKFHERLLLNLNKIKFK